MHPVLFDLGGFPLHAYGILGATGFVVMAALALRDARHKGFDADALVDVIFWTSLAALAGARGLFVVQHPEVIDGLWDVVNARNGGLVFYGAPIVGLPVAVWLMRRRGLPFRPVLDTFGKTLPLAHGISRIGCLLAGCCYGLPTDLPWGVTYDHPLSVAPHDVARHPVQAYEALGLFALSAAMFVLDRRKTFDGQVVLGWLGGYALLRMVTELFRGDAEREFVVPGLVSTSQGVAVVVLIVVAVLWRRWSRAPWTEVSG